MNRAGALCPNCKQPLAPGERGCKNCGEYHSQGNGSAGPVLSLYSPRAGMPIQNWPTQPGVMYENPEKKISELKKSSSPYTIIIPKKRKLFIVIGSALGMIFLLMAGSFALGRYSAIADNKLPRPNTLTSAPTLAPPPKNAQPAPSGAIDRNTLLRCDCDDPIRVTVTKVTVDQANGGKMVWSMTIQNVSGTLLYYNANFSLKDQRDKTFLGTGLQSSDLSPGKSAQVDVTFALAPVRGVPYTLNGTLIISGNYLQVNFQPAQFIF